MKPTPGEGIQRPIADPHEDEAIAAGLDDPEQIVERMLDPERRGELYPYSHRLRTLAPVHRSEARGLPPGTFVVTAFEAVDRIARSPAAVNDPRTARVFDYDGTGESPFYRMMSRAMLFLERSEHDRVRRIVYKAFTPSAIAPLRSLAEETADELIDAVMDTRQMDFVSQFAYPYPLRAIMRLLGIPRDAEATLERWAWDFARAGDPMSSTPERVARGNAAAEGFRDFFADLLALRERRPGQDLITTLLAAEADGRRLDREEIIATLVLLLQAGHETTADLLGNAMIGFFRHPDAWSSLVRTGVSGAAEELLRYDTSVQMSMRLARDPIEVAGVSIPAGSLIALGYGAANRDPSVFDDPDRLDVTRRPNHLSFSAGAYFCLGNALARTEIETALDVLVRRLPGIRPSGDHFTQRWTTRLRGPLELQVAW
jgi:cytochrome P450